MHEFCGSADAYESIREALATEAVAARLNQLAAAMTRFEVPSPNVIKLSFPRPVVQGSREDRDVHGAQVVVLVEEMLTES